MLGCINSKNNSIYENSKYVIQLRMEDKNLIKKLNSYPLKDDLENFPFTFD